MIAFDFIAWFHVASTFAFNLKHNSCVPDQKKNDFFLISSSEHLVIKQQDLLPKRVFHVTKLGVVFSQISKVLQVNCCENDQSKGGYHKSFVNRSKWNFIWKEMMVYETCIC